MNPKQLLLKNTTINLVGYTYLTLASLISIPITLHYLGTSNFALLALITTLVNFSTLFNFGLHAATIRYLALYSSHKSRATTYFQTSLFLILFLLTSYLLLLLLLKPLLLSKLHLPPHLFPLTLALICFNFLTSFFNTVPQAKNDFLFYNLKTLLVGTANTLLTAYLAFNFHSLFPILTARLFFQLLTLLFQLYYAQTNFSLYPIKIHHLRSTISNLTSYALRKFLGLLSSQGTFHLPRLVLATQFPLAQLPLFTIPQGLLARVQAALTQLTLALFPLSTHLFAKNKAHHLKKLILISETLVLIISILFNLLVFFFGQPFLILWLHNPQLANQISPILKLLTLVYSLSALSAIPATILDALGKPEIPAQFATFNLVLQIIFLTLFVPKFGFLGVPLALIAHNSIQVPLFLYRFTREIKKTC